MTTEFNKLTKEHFVLYSFNNTDVQIEVYFKNENIWLSQKVMAQLFECSSDNISLHLKNIFNEGELEKKAVTEEYSVTAADGKRYKTRFYNLDAIISVGYRVNSVQATQFLIRSDSKSMNRILTKRRKKYWEIIKSKASRICGDCRYTKIAYI